MAKHNCKWDKDVYEHYVQLGRGQGEMENYKPWIYIQSFSSKGTVSRIHSYKTGRLHHLLSQNELAYFYLLEWADEILDIREQYPLLDLELAMHIADASGIRYPCDKKSGFPYVLTCDFMLTTSSGIKARTIKKSTDLNNSRVIEKLEVERQYWKYYGIDWGIVTEKQIKMQKVKNIEWLYTAANIPKELENVILYIKVDNIDISTGIKDIADEIDSQFGLIPGSGILIIKHLLWNKAVEFNPNISLVG